MGGLVSTGMEILARAIPFLFGGLSQIPYKGKHLDQFETRDRLFISLNRFTAVPFVYHVLSAAINTPTVKLGLEVHTPTRSTHGGP